MSSPTFAHTLTNIALDCRCSSTNATRFLEIVPLIVGAGGTKTNVDAAVTLPAVSDRKSVHRIDFDRDMGVNAVLIRMKGSGNTGVWTVYSATISHTGPDPLGAVANLRAERLTETSFVAAWDPAARAESYALRVWQESVGEPSGSASLLSETFSSAVNSGGNPILVEDGTRGYDVPGWSGAAVYLPARSQGVIQIGTGKSTGWLLSPPLNSVGEGTASVVIHAKRYSHKDEGTRMPIDLVRGGETNTIGVFTLTDTWSYHATTLDSLQAGDRLLLHSITNGDGKRAWIDSVQILTDYVPGAVSTNEVLSVEGLATTSYALEDLSPETYWLEVRADAANEEGSWSLPLQVVLGSRGTGDEETPSAAATPEVDATHVTEHSLQISWKAIPNAVGYLVEASTNAVTPAREGEVLWREAFPRVYQLGTASEIQFPSFRFMTDSLWNGTNVYSCTTSDHAVQLGNTAGRGKLESEPLGLEGTGRVLKFTAWCLEGRNMPFEIVNDGQTKLTTDVVLGRTRVEHLLPLPELTPGDGLVFHSTTNAQSGRVCLGEMSILADYTPASTTTVTFIDRQLVTDCTFSLEGLATTVVSLRVGAVCEGVTNWSGVLAVDLAKPSATSVWRVSEFVSGEKSEDFGLATNILKETPWSNGTSVAGFHAFMGGQEVTSIRKDSGKSTVAGLYASFANDADGTHSLSLLGTSGKDVSLELRIMNDTPGRKVLCGADAAFRAYQWTFPSNGVGRKLEVAWAVTETAVVRPDESAWSTVEEAAFAAVEEPEEGRAYRSEPRRISTGAITVPSEGMLWLRWRVAREANSPMLGVGNVRVRVDFRRLPTVIHFR